MSCRSTALSVLFLLFLRVQSIHLTHARSVSSLPGFELPEIDGSPVDTCRMFFITTPAPATTTTETTTPITKKVITTTKKPAPPRKPETKNTGTPIRPRPAPVGPITNSLFYYLLANGRGHAAGSLPGFTRFISPPMGRQPHKGYGVTSDSDESDAAPLKRAGRTNEKRRKIDSLSSEDSSDES
ncbi:hypothetical protein VZT92_017401 [Zoarces viviparus]|uniref:Uncharacterized protein n=1 Tax=Zoarces viviparus TaxID=48416 RepID=A0AAW1ERQ2_ZOAVI